jgi:O-antigen/teichoic acid export membrane protein
MIETSYQKIGKFTRRLFLKESFLSHVFTLMTGTAISGAINAAVLPILSRCYAPENFGILAIFTALVSILSIWAAWRYELAIVLPEKQEDATAIVKLAFGIVIAMSLAGFAVVVTLGETLTGLFKISYMDSFLILLPLSIFFAGFYNVLFYWCSRNKRFDHIAIAKVFQNIVTLGSQLSAFFLFKVGAGGLISGYVIGQMGGVGILSARAKGLQLKEHKGPELRSMASRYADFPKLASLGAFLDTAAVQIPLIVIPALFSPYIGGIYAVTDRLMRMPAALVGSSVSQVFYQRLAQFKKEPLERKRLILSTWKYLFFLGVGPMMLVALLGPMILPFFLGSNWSESGTFAQILVFGFMGHFVASPTSLGIVALERLDILFFWQLLNFSSMVGVFFCSYLFFRGNILAFLWIWSVKEVIIYIIYMFALYRAHVSRE